MRIVSGRFKGRVFHPPKNIPTRPTTDFARTALFNILENRFHLDQVDVLDLFAGTGFITYEFLSRGARSVIAVDKDARCARFIKQTLKTLGVQDRAQMIKMDAFKFLRGWAGDFDLIFAGPPYPLANEIKKIHELVFKYERLRPGGWLIIEHDKRVDLSGLPYLIDQRHYGASIFSFFERPHEDVQNPPAE